jgi:hypothetical protein
MGACFFLFLSQTAKGQGLTVFGGENKGTTVLHQCSASL